MSEEITLAGGQLMQRAVLHPLKPLTQEQAANYPQRIEQIRAAAAADNHPTVAPTHVMMKGEQIIGYLSLGGLPVVQAWFDSHHKHAADSLKMIEHGETILREQGVRTCAIGCADNSPFTPHMERLGFKKLGVTTLWIKDL